jgi:hypothetical protein
VAGEASTISVACACGKKLRAPATSAGRTAKCPGCGAAIVIPIPELIELVEPDQPAVTPPPIPFNSAPQPVIPYRTPSSYIHESIVWRDNKLAVAQCDQPFPMRCVKCNARVQNHEMKKAVMYWQHPAYYCALLLGLLPGAIVLLCVRKKTDVTYGVCQTHRAKRRKMILIGWMIALAGLGCFALAVVMLGSDAWHHSDLVPVAWLLGIACIFGSLIWAVIAVPAISVKRIKDNRMWVGGAGEEFLASLEVQQVN